jgi:diguanylate cyclase (GGDEF)-like protein
MPTAEDIYRIYRIHHKDDSIERQLAGRFIVIGNEMHILEDYFGLLEDLQEGPLTTATLKALHRMNHSQYLEVIKQGDIYGGARMDLLPEAKFEDGKLKEDGVEAKRPPPVFEYHRAGYEQPQHLEMAAGKALLNGQELTPDEVKVILQNVKSGLGTLRYKKSTAEKIKKMEQVFEDLQKEEKDLYGVMDKLRGLAQAGHIDPKEMETLHRELYGDQMVPEIGNKRAYKDFLTRPKEGVHIMMDANDFKGINDEHGHHAGDEAIKHLGNSMRQAMDETVGQDQGKLFRFGGDEFAAHVPSHEHAAQFARSLRSKLEGIPAIGGTHRLSVSMGMGHNPETADKALNLHAKGAKNDAIAAITGVRGSRQAVRAPEALYAHSLVPGHEGAVPAGGLRKPHIPPAVAPAEKPIDLQPAPAPQPPAPAKRA